MQVRVYRIGGGKFGGPLVAVLALAAGAVLVAFGMVMLAGLAIAGTVAGTGALLYRAIRGRRSHAPLLHQRDDAPLDPRLEVRARVADVTTLPPGGELR